ncbi:MAG: DUF5329 domain-containing protein [Xanthomonadales bacterium]|nr:DUF5329 domain-containing protein [Xanthomonadales bacterium]
MKTSLLALLLILEASAAGSAPDPDQEIDALLTAVGDSGCTFIRNGKSYDADKAESHLRMKYSRGKRYAKTTEDFIDRLASRSSFSGREYFIDCEDEATVSSGSWLKARLLMQRNAQGLGSGPSLQDSQ